MRNYSVATDYIPDSGLSRPERSHNERRERFAQINRFSQNYRL